MDIYVSSLFDKSLSKASRRIQNDLEEIRNFIRIIPDERDLYSRNSFGFKKYKGTKNIYGIDVGNTHSKGNDARRLICACYTYESNTMFIRYKESNSTGRYIVLVDIVKHDEQNRKALLASNGISEWDITNEEEKIIESLNNNDIKFRKVFNSFKDGTPVLTLDKFETIDKFINESGPVVLPGIAGSGKTEIIIRTIEELLEIYYEGETNVLYVTRSNTLLSNVQGRFKNPKNVDFYTIKSLLVNYLDEIGKEHGSEVDSFYSFTNFCNELIHLERSTYSKQEQELIKFVQKCQYYPLYLEIYGFIFGFMNLNWDRIETSMINTDTYLNENYGYCIYGKNDRSLVYELAKKYRDYLEVNKIINTNEVSFDFSRYENRKQYQYIFIDEGQDLTEVEDFMLLSLLAPGCEKNVLFSFDREQIVTPTFFNIGRFRSKLSLTEYNDNRKYKFGYNPLTDNFRNPSSVVKLINSFNIVRTKYVQTERNEDRVMEKVRNKLAGYAGIFNGNISEIIEKFGHDPKTVIIVTDDYYRDFTKSISQENLGNYVSLRTVTGVKGCEYDNVFVANFLSSRSVLSNSRGFEQMKMDYLLLSNYYVAITRTSINLVLLEQNDSGIVKEVFEQYRKDYNKSLPVENVLDDIVVLGEYNAIEYIERADQEFDQGRYKEASYYYQYALKSNEISDDPQLKKYIDNKLKVSDVLKLEIDESTKGDMLIALNEYNLAKTYYKEAGDKIGLQIINMIENEATKDIEFMFAENKVTYERIKRMGGIVLEAFNLYLKKKTSNLKQIKDKNKVQIELINKQTRRINK